MTEHNFTKHLRTLNGQRYFSQACQDLFVVAMLDGKTNGVYCEVGGADPYESNNTFLLENDYGWSGISLEFDQKLVQQYNTQRRNICICSDATTFDYRAAFEKANFPKNIDYLSLDIEPAENTYKSMISIPFDEYRFAVITYEHDFHLSGEEYMLKSRDFLKSKGYQIVVQNVKSFGRDFEDWWIHPSLILQERWKPYQNNSIEFSEIFKKT